MSGLASGTIIGAGGIFGPSSATDEAIAVFDGTSGKILKEDPGDLSPTFAGLDLTGITNGNIPYISASGFADSPLSTNGTDITCTGSMNLDTVGTDTYQIAGNTALAMPVDNTNIAIGYHALLAATTGASGNVALGYQTLLALQDGTENAAFGRDAGKALVSTSYNAIFGFEAMLSSTNGQQNCAFGYRSMRNGASGNFNVAIGFQSLYSSTGSYNVSVGYLSLFKDTSGDRLTAVGKAALYSNTTGYRASAFGYEAAVNNTTGQYNTAIGYQALNQNQTGHRTTAVGTESCHNTTGSYQTALGYRSLYAHTSGIGNLALGYRAGDNITTGSYNIIIGYDVDAPAAATDYQLNIGNVIYGDLTAATTNITINANTISANYDLMLAGDGVLGLKETTTPTADANYGKIYTKNDNNIYFQDGAGNEYLTGGASGYSGSFTNGDGDTVTVTNGLITGIA